MHVYDRHKYLFMRQVTNNKAEACECVGGTGLNRKSKIFLLDCFFQKRDETQKKWRRLVFLCKFTFTFVVVTEPQSH